MKQFALRVATLGVACALAGIALAANSSDAPKAVEAAPTPAAGPTGTAIAAAAPATVPNRYVRDGVVLEFGTRAVTGDKLMDGDLVDLRFKLTDERSGAPIRGATPAAWLDVPQNIGAGAQVQQRGCLEKIALYLRGVVGMRPMVDMNSYYVLVMNRDASISVVDPVVSMGGRTSTLASIVLRRAPMDWALAADEKLLYVTMPAANQVAVIDTQDFTVKASVPAGKEPTRIVVQPDGRYVWVGNNSHRAKERGATVLDAETFKEVAFFETGSGHHEIAFTEDSRYAFVSNRDSGNVTVIDVRTLKTVKDIATGPTPIALAYSPLSRAVYVADGKSGTVSVIDSGRLEVVKTLTAKPGLGPLRFTQDGRWGFVVNPANDRAYVVDAATNELVHEIETGSQPFQVTFSRAFAYIRGLGTERVSMVNLASLGRGNKPIVQSFQAGNVAPRQAGDLPLAVSMATARKEAAAFIVNPADNTTYFYMEGMNAPMSNYKVFGHMARAVTVVDRSLKEIEPGVYSARVRMPAAGAFDVGFTANSPKLTHCFALQAEENPALTATLQIPWKAEFMIDDRKVPAGKELPVRFRVVNPRTSEPQAGIKDLTFYSYRVPNVDQRRGRVREVEKGVYEAVVPLPSAGAYYVFVESRSLNVDFTKGLMLTLQAIDKVN